MKVLGFDVETTGLDTAKDFIIEMGAVVFDVQEGLWEPIFGVSKLIKEPSYPELTDEIKELTGIESLEGAGSFLEAYAAISPLLAGVEVIIAHNARFDRAMLRANLERMGLMDTPFHKLPWICSIDDLVAVQKYKCKKLSHLALDVGVAIDPSTLHRADADVRLMGQMLTKLKADPQAMLDFSRIPEIIIQAQVPHPKYDKGVGIAQAKACGFGFKQIRGVDEVFDNLWIKKIKEPDFETERTKCPFPIHNLRRLPCCN